MIVPAIKQIQQFIGGGSNGHSITFQRILRPDGSGESRYVGQCKALLVAAEVLAIQCCESWIEPRIFSGEGVVYQVHQILDLVIDRNVDWFQ